MNLKLESINLSNIMENGQEVLQELLQAGCCSTAICESPLTPSYKTSTGNELGNSEDI
ncbi:hypothetical protein [Sporosarcina sp. Marseille-Q4943]|uniref:hypothetical protein n=1 Tax=Sporosarcina sp. Marseille-Q4943 TaxID=2942204 RepID=UPI00208DC0A7|nr:hypothetical protein [Sporosarcina sp. Marseille-Q4943]